MGTISEILDIVGKFVAIVVGLITLIESISQIRGKPPEQSWWQTTKIIGQWLFLVISTLGFPSIFLAFIGANLGTFGYSNINDQFLYSIGYVTALSIFYGVIWGGVIRPWLGQLLMRVTPNNVSTNVTERNNNAVISKQQQGN